MFDFKELYGSRILITGATGMICSTVAEILFDMNKKNDAGIKIILAGRNKERMLQRFSGFKEGVDFEFTYFDATKACEIETESDYVIHGASNANPAAYSSHPVETLVSNIIGTDSLLKYCKKNGVKRFLYISSSEVYGRKDEPRQYMEDDYGFVDILKARACYPNGKRGAETLCASYIDEYNLDCVIVRPGHIYGPQITSSDNRATAQFSRNAIKGENIVMKSSGSQMRSYCYTEDCATAILTVLIKGKCGEAYNISNKKSIVSIRQVAQEIADCAGTKLVFEKPTDSEEKGYNMMDNSSLCSEKLEALGWQAEYGLKEGVKKTIEMLKKGRNNE